MGDPEYKQPPGSFSWGGLQGVLLFLGGGWWFKDRKRRRAAEPRLDTNESTYIDSLDWYHWYQVS